jgi:hypothetical protein
LSEQRKIDALHVEAGRKLTFFPNISEREDIERALEFAMKIDAKETEETRTGSLGVLARFYLDMRLCALLCPGEKVPQTPWWWLSDGILQQMGNRGCRDECSFDLSDDHRVRVEKAVQLAMEVDKVTTREAALRCIGSFYGGCRTACSLGEPETPRGRIQ